MRTLRGTEDGFALLDALIAVALLAGTVSLVPAMIVQARQMVAQAGSHYETRLVADAVLTELTLLPPQIGFRRGEEAGRSWQATTRLYKAPADDASALYGLRLVVEIGRGRQLVVERLLRGGPS